jgi:hypothetical protein
MSSLEAMDIPYTTYASAAVPESSNLIADWLTQVE